jgi:hypothetical protein
MASLPPSILSVCNSSINNSIIPLLGRLNYGRDFLSDPRFAPKMKSCKCVDAAIRISILVRPAFWAGSTRQANVTCHELDPVHGDVGQLRLHPSLSPSLPYSTLNSIETRLNASSSLAGSELGVPYEVYAHTEFPSRLVFNDQLSQCRSPRDIWRDIGHPEHGNRLISCANAGIWLSHRVPFR